MINQNFMIASRALNANHTKNQTIITLGLMLLASGGLIYHLYKIAEEQLAEKNDLKKQNDLLQVVIEDCDTTNKRLNAEVLYYIEQITALTADKKKESTSKSGKALAQNS